MIDEGFLYESYETRMDLVRKLGCRDAEDTQHRLRLLVNQCLDDINALHRDRPDRKRYKGSNESTAVKIPSQRLKDIEEEFDELIKWFEGGNRPRLRNLISSYAIRAMLGHPPFGRNFIILAKQEISSTTTPDRPSDHLLFGLRGCFFDILSSDKLIAACQIDLYSNLRAKDGEPLYLAIVPIEMNWPVAFEELVRQRKHGTRDVLIEDLEAAVSRDDFPRMALETKRTNRIIRFMRGNSDQRSKATVGRWARCEPAFELISAMLDEVWPTTKGHPQENRLGERHGDGRRSERQLLRDLVQNLADLVQEKLNTEAEFRSEKYDNIRAPNHFLSKSGSSDYQLNKLFKLILGLRQELVAYMVAQHTITAICDAARKDELVGAADSIRRSIIAKIDDRIVARRIFLNFGADHLQGNALKWCGRLDPNIRQRWEGAATLAGMAYPVPDLDQDRHLALCADLVRRLDPGIDALQAWTQLDAWAKSEGRKFWHVVIPDIEDRGSFSMGEFFLG